MGVSLVPMAQRASIMRLSFISEGWIQNLNSLFQKVWLLWLGAVFGTEALIQKMYLLSKKPWVLWLRSCFGAVKETLGAALGVSLVPRAQRVSIMRLLFISEGLIQNLNSLFPKLWVLRLRAA